MHSNKWKAGQERKNGKKQIFCLVKPFGKGFTSVFINNNSPFQINYRTLEAETAAGKCLPQSLNSVGKRHWEYKPRWLQWKAERE